MRRAAKLLVAFAVLFGAVASAAPAEAHRFGRFGFGYPVFYGPALYPPPRPLYVAPQPAYYVPPPPAPPVVYQRRHVVRHYRRVAHRVCH